MKTQRERDEEKRAKRAEEIREQVEAGTLVIRQMTPAERKKYPAQPRPPKKPRR